MTDKKSTIEKLNDFKNSEEYKQAVQEAFDIPVISPELREKMLSTENCECCFCKFHRGLG